MSGHQHKSRFSGLDVLAAKNEFESVAVGKRISNIYDINDKTFLLKLASPGDSEKTHVLIESGVRLHLTRFMRNKSDMPNPFCMKLRKHLKSKRLDGVDQIGTDRVIDMRFGSGDTAHHLLVEMYSKGNIILTDESYIVLALLRTHQFDTDVVCKVGEPYPIAFATSAMDAGGASSTTEKGVPDMTPAEFQAWANGKEVDYNERCAVEQQTGSDKNKKKTRKKLFLRQALLAKDSGISAYGPDLIDHCLLKCAGPFCRSTYVESVADTDMVDIASFIEQVKEAGGIFQALSSGSRKGKGFIMHDTVEEGVSPENYTEYVSILLHQHEGKQYKEFDTFSEAVDDYYARIEDQKVVREAASIEEAAIRKIEKVKLARTDQIQSIASKQKRLELSAGLVEMHAAEIDKLALVLNSAVANGMTWADIQAMVEDESSRGNAIASLVTKLHLDRNAVVVRLRNFDVPSDSDKDSEDDEDHEEKTAADAYLNVEIQLQLSAHANARDMFQNKKLAMVNEEKTVEASLRAVNSIEGQVMRQLESQKVQRNMKLARRVHWFERFAWFITREGYLVISGRDANQNEAIVSKYMRADDVYVHADVPGASICLLRRKPLSAGASVSPYAIHEAGNFCMCRSSAWSTNAVTSPWWVWGAQISKNTPHGDTLQVGSFVVHGRKNILPPMSYELGFGIMFRLDEASAARHMNDRKDKASMDEDETMSVMSDAAERYGLDEVSTQFSYSKTFLPVNNPKTDVLLAAGIGTLSLNTKSSKKDGNYASDCEEWGEKNGEDGDDDEEEEVFAESIKGVCNARTADRNSVPIQTEKMSRAEKKKTDAEAERKAEIDRQKSSAGGGAKKKKKVDKKKARRYAEQDEEDRELAMQSLGHGGKPAEKIKAQVERISKAEKLERVGVTAFKEKANALVAERITDLIREKMDDLFQKGLLCDGDIAVEHLATLTSFNDEDASKVLNQFESGLQLTPPKGGSKSAFLASIMLRFKQGKKEKKQDNGNANGNRSTRMRVVGENKSHGEEEAEEKDGDDDEGGEEEDDKVKSEAVSEEVHDVEALADAGDDKDRKDKDKPEEVDKEEIIMDAALFDEDELSVVEDVHSITGEPIDGDVILYAIPCCGPYSAIKDFKYRLKLTHGTQKKGKVAKFAIDAFSRASFASAEEKMMMLSLTETEMASTLVGEIRINMPGMQKIKNLKKEIKKGDKTATSTNKQRGHGNGKKGGGGRSNR